MRKLLIGASLALSFSVAQAQTTSPAHPPSNIDNPQPFHFDGRMKGDGQRHEVLKKDRRKNVGGAIVMPPKGDHRPN
jgi:Protein of unknown function (DUF3551)